MTGSIAEVLSANSLCYNNGPNFALNLEVYCVPPLKGSFVTIQKVAETVMRGYNWYANEVVKRSDSAPLALTSAAFTTPMA